MNEPRMNEPRKIADEEGARADSERAEAADARVAELEAALREQQWGAAYATDAERDALLAQVARLTRERDGARLRVRAFVALRIEQERQLAELREVAQALADVWIGAPLSLDAFGQRLAALRAALAASSPEGTQ